MSIKRALLVTAAFTVSIASASVAQAADGCTMGQAPKFCVHVVNIRHPRYLYFYIYIPSWTKQVSAGVGVSHWNVLDGSRLQYQLRRYGNSNRSKRTYIGARPGSNPKVQVQMCLKLTPLPDGSSCGPWYEFTLIDPVSRRVDGKGHFDYEYDARRSRAA